MLLLRQAKAGVAAIKIRAANIVRPIPRMVLPFSRFIVINLSRSVFAAQRYAESCDKGWAHAG